MGYPLHGNELSESISANVGGAAWAIAYEKPNSTEIKLCAQKKRPEYHVDFAV